MLNVNFTVTGDTCLIKLLPQRECNALFDSDICNVRNLINLYKESGPKFRQEILKFRNLGISSIGRIVGLIDDLKEYNSGLFDDKEKEHLWEQRKFELVKAYSVELIKLQMEKGVIDCGYSEQKVSEYSIALANKVIEHLSSNKLAINSV